MSESRKTSREAKTRVDRGEASASRAKSDSPACFVVIYGPDLGRRAILGPGPFEIGRSPKADLTIDQESVSRNHARVTWNEREHSIEDLNSTNGVFVNDMRVLRVPLANGDQVKVGRSILKYMCGNDLETSYHEAIYRIMTTDALSGAYNHRYFSESTGREFNRAVRYRRPLSLIVFDIDRMTLVNDQFGQVAGDSVIRQLAQVILPRTREQDITARLGGQEFALLMPEVDRAGAMAAGDKIRRIAEAARFTVEGQDFTITVSVGVSSVDKGTESPELLLKRAMSALRRAKEQGRNRVESA